MAKSENLLTVTKLKALKLTQKGERISDGGGLSGTVSATRDGTVSVSFAYQYRSGEKRREKRIGTWPKMDLAEIRAERDRLRNQVASGVDPIEKERQDEIAALQQLAREEEDRRQQEAEQARLAARMHFQMLFERWSEAHVCKLKRGAETVRRIEKNALPTLGNVFIDEITRAMVASVVRSVSNRGSLRNAHLLLGELSQCFRWAISEGLLEPHQDPTLYMDKKQFGATAQMRERVLDESELRHLLQSALPGSKMTHKAKASIRVLLGTMVRVGELLRAKRAEVDLEKKEWLIPAENAKNGKAHLVHLSDFSVEAFAELLAIHDHGTWIFPDRTGTSHVSITTLTKQITDRQKNDAAPLLNRSKDTQSLSLSGGHWTAHDLRRTGATIMGELGVLPNVIDKCQNHVEQNRVRATYQRQELLSERRAAFDLLGQRLALLANPNANNVIPFKNHAA